MKKTIFIYFHYIQKCFHGDLFIFEYVGKSLNSTLCNSCPSGVFKGSALICCGEMFTGQWLRKSYRIIFERFVHIIQKGTHDHKQYF